MNEIQIWDGTDKPQPWNFEADELMESVHEYIISRRRRNDTVGAACDSYLKAIETLGSFRHCDKRSFDVFQIKSIVSAYKMLSYSCKIAFRDYDESFNGEEATEPYLKICRELFAALSVDYEAVYQESAWNPANSIESEGLTIQCHDMRLKAFTMESDKDSLVIHLELVRRDHHYALMQGLLVPHYFKTLNIVECGASDRSWTTTSIKRAMVCSVSGDIADCDKPVTIITNGHKQVKTAYGRGNKPQNVRLGMWFGKQEEAEAIKKEITRAHDIFSDRKTTAAAK